MIPVQLPGQQLCCSVSRCGLWGSEEPAGRLPELFEPYIWCRNSGAVLKLR